MSANRALVAKVLVILCLAAACTRTCNPLGETCHVIVRHGMTEQAVMTRVEQCMLKVNVEQDR